jgi:dTDP-4-dehydrorhamnose reductase
MILVFGSQGQLGNTLRQQIGQAPEHVFLKRDSTDYCGDITNTAGITETLMDLRPEIIINAAAYTAVDQAEADIEAATAINAKAPAVLAQIAAKTGGLLIHYSTDYVFDGTKNAAYHETDICHPLSVYGKTKRQGEEGILASHCRHYILRTSWLYSAHGNNFLTTMLRLSQTQDELRVINDQWGAPTSTELLVNATLDLIHLATPGYGSPSTAQPPADGIYHCAPSGETTWFEYARLVIQTAQALGLETKVKKITPILAADYRAAAPRPMNSRLDTTKLHSVLGTSFDDWREDVIMTVGQALREEPVDD